MSLRDFTLVAQADGRLVVNDEADTLTNTFAICKMRPDSKDCAGRVHVPFRRTEDPGRLNALRFAPGASQGTQRGALPTLRTSVGQRYFSYVTPAATGGERTRITPAAFCCAFHQVLRDLRAHDVRGRSRS